MTKIDQKIVGYAVVSKEGTKEVQQPELKKRPEILTGTTYKLKTPLSEHALYITINDHEIQGQRRPFEIFINSKAMEHFQWIVAFTRIVSAIFRQGGEVNFLIEELRSVFDPKGGGFHKAKYVPSLVAAIGDVLEQHLISLGLHERDTSLAVAAQAMVKEKLAAQDGIQKAVCQKCNEAAVVVASGCATCLACGDSRCS